MFKKNVSVLVIFFTLLPVLVSAEEKLRKSIFIEFFEDESMQMEARNFAEREVLEINKFTDKDALLEALEKYDREHELSSVCVAGHYGQHIGSEFWKTLSASYPIDPCRR